jgi:glutamyl-tRNA reductase
VLADADVVFAATSAVEPVVGPGAFADGAPRTRQVIDLGVPRNVDPAVRAVPGLRLLDVDALRGWARGGVRPAAVRDAARAEERAAADAEIAVWVARFGRWLATQQVVPTITQLRDDAERIRAQELERALARLGDLNPREREVVRSLSARLVAKLLHHPLVALTEEPDAPALADSARRLFGLARPGAAA